MYTIDKSSEDKQSPSPPFFSSFRFPSTRILYVYIYLSQTDETLVDRRFLRRDPVLLQLSAYILKPV